jgi:hypothetical protein
MIEHAQRSQCLQISVFALVFLFSCHPVQAEYIYKPEAHKTALRLEHDALSVASKGDRLRAISLLEKSMVAEPDDRILHEEIQCLCSIGRTQEALKVLGDNYLSYAWY